MDDSGGFGAPPPPPPPSAGGGGQLPQRDFGDVFSTAFNVYKAHFAQLLKIVALIVVPLTLPSTSTAASPSTRSGSTAYYRTRHRAAWMPHWIPSTSSSATWL